MGGEVGFFVSSTDGSEVGNAVDKHVHSAGTVGLPVGREESVTVGGDVGCVVGPPVGEGVMGGWVGPGVGSGVGEGVFFARYLLWVPVFLMLSTVTSFPLMR